MYHRGDPICQIMHRDDKFLLQRIRRYWRPWEIPEYEPHFLQRGSYSHSKGTSQSRPQNLTDSWINVLKGSHNREFFYTTPEQAKSILEIVSNKHNENKEIIKTIIVKKYLLISELFVFESNKETLFEYT